MEGRHRQIAIVNPMAGGGRAPRRWSKVQERLAVLGVSVETVYSARIGHAGVLACRAVQEGCSTVIAVGGDGTVNEVVNGLYRGEPGLGTALAVVPAGTGMDFARNMQLPHRAKDIAEAIAAGIVRSIDVGLVHSPAPKLFVNFAETGLGAAVVAREARFAPTWPGRISYLLAAVGAAVREDNIQAAIDVEGERVYDGPLVSVVIANGRFFGGGIKIAPRASVVDGELDVLILGDFSRAQLVAQIWKIYPGTHLDHPKVLWLRGRRVQVEPRPETRLDLDGELSGRGPYSFSVLPLALRVVCPPD